MQKRLWIVVAWKMKNELVNKLEQGHMEVGYKNCELFVISEAVTMLCSGVRIQAALT
jgi:hypothetical protein